MNGPFVLYYWVSTDRQLHTGHALKSQQAAALAYLGAAAPIAEFTEVPTGKRNDRPQLGRALALCRKRKARLVIAKLGHLARNPACLAALMDSDVEFAAVDNPYATRQTLHILVAVAERQRKTISDRSKAAIEAAKARGVRIGRKRLDRSNAKRRGPTSAAAAIERARQLAPVLAELQGAGMSAHQMAAELTARKVPTATGAKWYAQTVIRVLHRAAALTPTVGFFDIPNQPNAGGNWHAAADIERPIVRAGQARETGCPAVAPDIRAPASPSPAHGQKDATHRVGSCVSRYPRAGRRARA
jgi:DNA invertase Pin-like site-specific DNA recombinase